MKFIEKIISYTFRSTIERCEIIFCTSVPRCNLYITQYTAR